MLQNFSVAISVSPRVCFVLVLILISMFLRQCIYELGIFHAGQAAGCQGAGAELAAGVGRPRNGWGPLVVSLLAVPRRHLCFVSSWLFFFFLHCSFHYCVCLASDSSIVATCPSVQLPALLFVCISFVWFLLFVVVFLENQSRTKGEGWSTTN